MLQREVSIVFARCVINIRPLSFIALGTDAHSCDPGQNNNRNPCHEETLPNGVILLEFVANLDRMPPVNSTVFLGPMKMRDGSGGPVRILAMYGEDVSGMVGRSSSATFSLLLVFIGALVSIFI